MHLPPVDLQKAARRLDEGGVTFPDLLKPVTQNEDPMKEPTVVEVSGTPAPKKAKKPKKPVEVVHEDEAHGVFVGSDGKRTLFTFPRHVLKTIQDHLQQNPPPSPPHMPESVTVTVGYPDGSSLLLKDVPTEEAEESFAQLRGSSLHTQNTPETGDKNNGREQPQPVPPSPQETPMQAAHASTNGATASASPAEELRGQPPLLSINVRPLGEKLVDAGVLTGAALLAGTALMAVGRYVFGFGKPAAIVPTP